MCGRFLLSSPPDIVAELFAVDAVSFEPRWNIAPTQSVPVIRGGEAGARRLDLLRWGLVPSWAKDPAIGNRMINARSETAHEKPSFRTAMRRRRCLIVADGFYEWKRDGDRKRPHCIRLAGDGPFGMAGLWETWHGPDSGTDPLETCTILTTAANALVKPIHDRMPVIVGPGNVDRWLDPSQQDPEAVADLLAPFDADAMHAFEVSTLVNRPANDDPACLEPPSS